MIGKLRQRIARARFYTLHTRSLSGIGRWQDERLRALVTYAARNVPMWRELLSGAGLTSGSVHGVIDLERLPLTSKETYIGRMVEEYIDGSRNFFPAWRNTSGSSGIPFRSLAATNSRQYTDFATLRFLWWRGMILASLRRIKIAQIKISASTHENRLFIPVAQFQTEPEAVLSKLAAFKPEVLMSYPSILLDIARMVRDRKRALPFAPAYVLSFGEMLSPAARTFISEALGAEVYDRYGLEEIGVVGVECVVHDGFHVNSESVVVEITDAVGLPLTSGAYGKVVVTDLLNYNMPFIRYDTGDHGRISSEPCACGLRAPRIWVDGRYTASLAFGTRRVHHLEFDGVLDSFMNAILQYQIVKVSEDEVSIRLVPGIGYGETLEETVRASVANLVGPTIHVSVEVVQSLPQMPSGKCRIVTDESIPR